MDKLPIPRLERESFIKHRRDVTRQIILPVVLATLIGIVFAVLAGFGAAGSSAGVSLWADISLIWLIIPMMFLALLLLMLMAAMVYGLNRLLKVSPHYTALLQTYALWLTTEVNIRTDKLIKPVLYIKSWLDLLLKSKSKEKL